MTKIDLCTLDICSCRVNKSFFVGKINSSEWYLLKVYGTVRLVLTFSLNFTDVRYRRIDPRGFPVHPVPVSTVRYFPKTCPKLMVPKGIMVFPTLQNLWYRMIDCLPTLLYDTVWNATYSPLNLNRIIQNNYNWSKQAGNNRNTTN